MKTTGDFYAKFYPKPRTGKECKKTNCKRYKEYAAWELDNGVLKFCMSCRHAHVSQYEAAISAAKGE